MAAKTKNRHNENRQVLPPEEHIRLGGPYGPNADQWWHDVKSRKNPLLTPRILKMLPSRKEWFAQYGDCQIEDCQAPVTLRYFHCLSDLEWYPLSADWVEWEDQGDIVFWGYVIGPFPELGDFSLESLRHIGRLSPFMVERDTYSGKSTLAEVFERTARRSRSSIGPAAERAESQL